MKTKKTIVTAHQLAEMRGYSDVEKLIDEAERAGVLFEQAGTPHIWLEAWDAYMQKAAASLLSARKKSGTSLDDTVLLGIVNSNLTRLPESIRIKERKLRSKEALYKGAETDNEKYILSGEIGQLKDELRRHRENLKKAQQRQKEILARRAAELDALEAEGEKADNLSEGKSSAK